MSELQSFNGLGIGQTKPSAGPKSIQIPPRIRSKKRSDTIRLPNSNTRRALIARQSKASTSGTDIVVKPADKDDFEEDNFEDSRPSATINGALSDASDTVNKALSNASRIINNALRLDPGGVIREAFKTAGNAVGDSFNTAGNALNSVFSGGKRGKVNSH